MGTRVGEDVTVAVAVGVGVDEEVGVGLGVEVAVGVQVGVGDGMSVGKEVSVGGTGVSVGGNGVLVDGACGETVSVSNATSLPGEPDGWELQPADNDRSSRTEK